MDETPTDPVSDIDPWRTVPRTSTRRTLLRGVGALSALGAMGLGGHHLYRVARPEVDPRTVIPLYSQTVAYDATEQRMLVGAAADDRDLTPSSRLTTAVPATAGAAQRAQQFWEGTEGWRAHVHGSLAGQRGHVDRDAPPEEEPQDGPQALASLANSAIRDLWVLSDQLPAPVAAWTPYWRYVWPRDAAFCAVALARIGHHDQALSALEHLQSLQLDDGWFEARYVPDTDRAPDDRPRQFDGTGLLLWATSEVWQKAPASERGAIADRLTPLISTSQELLLSSTRDGERPPPASPDYWEVRERSVTLAIMASTLTGLRSAHAITGEERTRAAADAFTRLLTSTFGPQQYQRYRRHGGADSARAFFDATGCHGIIEPRLLLSLRSELARPGGGIAPGASWRDDGISWTPSTSLLALALARAGERDAALEVLEWLASHRTEAGSLPEKVLFDGRPAAVAPLAWTAANVLLALDALAEP